MGDRNKDKNSPAWISTRKDLDFLDDDISAQIEKRHPTQRRKPLYTAIMAAPNKLPMPTLPPININDIGSSSNNIISAARKYNSPTESVASRFSQRLMDRERNNIINAKNGTSPAMSEMTETQLYSSSPNGTALPTPRRLSTVHDNAKTPSPSSESSSGSDSSASSKSAVLLSGYSTRKQPVGGGTNGRIRPSQSSSKSKGKRSTPATASRNNGIGDIDDGDDESVSCNDYKASTYPFPDRVLHWIHPMLFVTEKIRKCVERACLVEAYKSVEDGLTSDESKLHEKMKKRYLEVVNSIPDDAFQSMDVSTIL